MGDDDDGTVVVPALKSLRSALYRQISKRLPKLPAIAGEICLNEEW